MATFGGTIGYNYQLDWGILGQKWVVGVEGDIGYFDTSNAHENWNERLGWNTKTRWLATALSVRPNAWAMAQSVSRPMTISTSIILETGLKK